MSVKTDANYIIEGALKDALPHKACARALANVDLGDSIYVVAIGKAAYTMAEAAADILGDQVKDGIAITKYDHVQGEIEGIRTFEAAHPLPDENGIIATNEVLEMVAPLKETDTVLFLVSGGGSSLFESPLVELSELQDITDQLLSCGADVVEINTIRKRLSRVKGGKFAELCAPAQIYSVILSDVVGDPIDMIASGPASADTSTCTEALYIAQKYHLQMSTAAKNALTIETPSKVTNCRYTVSGNVAELCKSAKDYAEKLGYKAIMLSDCITCEAREAGALFGSIARCHSKDAEKVAFIAGGEPIVHVTGEGLGGRNQEFALAAAPAIDGLKNVCVASIGSDGTDGPTDAAGGIVDGSTMKKLRDAGISIDDTLANNDAYHALVASEGLIYTGPTGTNVNDFMIILIDNEG